MPDGGEKMQAPSNGYAQYHGEDARLLDTFSGDQLEILSEDGLSVALMLPTQGGRAVGVEVTHTSEIGSGALEVGLSSVLEVGAVLGISTPGYESQLHSQTTGLDIAISQKLGGNSVLRLAGQYGNATATGAGVIDSFTGITYTGFGLEVDNANLFSTGDVFTVFARQPIGITSGSASLNLATRRVNANSYEFSNFDIDLSPSSRQLDVGFSYRTAIGNNTEVMLGLTYTENRGNITDARETVGLAAVQLRF
ncbi:MAG TPA: hypothetical protein EYQ00_02525 [Dehalococcoidia bacterium]|nr:hypothetical protein [Dehalococcoidia bacterium]